MTYEQNAESITLAIWEESTGNGHNLPRDDWDSHMQNCQAATANSYHDGISVAEWHKAALRRLTRES